MAARALTQERPAMRNVTAIRDLGSGNKEVKPLFSDDPTELETFAQFWNNSQQHFDVYDCVAKLTDGARERRLETVRSLSFLHVDVDLRALETAQDTVLSKLRSLPLPLEIRSSGGGYHVLAQLKEPVETGSAEFDRANALRRQLTYLLAGDPAPDHAAALLRRVGTFNYKHGEPRLCHVIQTGAPVDLTEIEELVELLGDTPLFVAKVKEPKGNGHDKAEWRHVNADADLAVMAFGDKDHGIHNTQLTCAASRLRAGIPVEDVVAEVLAATRQAVGGDAHCTNWDWIREERDIARMAYDFINKNVGDSPELAELLPEPLLSQWRERTAAGDRFLRIKYSGFGGGRFVIYSRKTAADSQPKAEGAPKGALFVLKPRGIIDPGAIPAREWLGGGRFYQRRTVCATIAPGDYGKTTLSVLDAISFQTGRKLLDEQPKEPLRVWYHSGEDPLEELDRRFAAACIHYGIPLEEIAGLFITNTQTVPLRVAEGYSEIELNTRLIKCIHEQIGDNKIDVCIFEPLVTLHGVPENDNAKMDRVIRIFAGIADDHNCGIGVNAHTRKGSNGEEKYYTVDDMRGGSAVRDAVRAARALNRITAEDAARAAILEYERSRYIRIDRAKGNNSAASETRWVTFANVTLPRGDDVGVMTLWTPPLDKGHVAETHQQAAGVFLAILQRYNAADRRVSDSANAKNYAPRQFAHEPEARDAVIGKALFEHVMNDMLADRTIRIREEGKGGHTKRWLEIS
jgi:RecA-family ATPase